MNDSGSGTSPNDNTSNAVTFTITVNAVNDTPVRTSAAASSITVDEDSNNTTAVSLGLSGLTYAVGGGSDETSQTLTAVKITNIPSAIALFQSDGTTAVALNATLSLTQLQGLKYKTIADANGTGTLTWTVQDSGGTANSGIDTLTDSQSITVTAVNDVPSFTIPTSASADEGDGAVTVNNFATSISAGPANESSQTLLFNVSVTGTTGNLAFTTAPDIDSTGKLTFTLADDTNGTATISVVLADSGSGTSPNVNTSAAQTFTLTVDAVNDAPELTSAAAADISVDEDSANSTAVSLGLTGLTYGVGGGSDEATQTLTLKLTNIPTFISVFQADGTTAVSVNESLTLDQFQDLTYTTTADANGTADLTWTVQDSGGTANGGIDLLTDGITITVDPVNDVPSFTLNGNPPTVLEGAGPQSVSAFATSISAGPSNESTQTLSFTVTVTGGNLTFTADPQIDSSGNLTYEVASGSSGTATFSVVLTDSGDGTAPNVNVSGAQMFTITVTADTEGEGESAGFTANDLALLAYLINFDSTPGSLEVSEEDWVTAVDQAMALLG